MLGIIKEILDYINNLFKLIYDQIVNTDYSIKPMFLGFILSIFSFNYFNPIVSYLKNTVKFRRERLNDKKYKKYKLEDSYKFDFKCEIHAYISKSNAYDPHEILLEDIIKYENDMNEFITYYMKSYERVNKGNFTFGLSEMIDDERIKYKIKDIQPSIRVVNKSVCGILTVITYTKLNEDEINILKNEISNKLFDVFGESFEQTTIKINNKRLFLQFTDDNLKCSLKYLRS